MDYFARDACGLTLAAMDAPDWPQEAASASPCRFRPIPSLAMSPAEDGHLAGSGAQIWPWSDGSMRCREGQRPSAVWNGWQTDRVRHGGMTGWVALEPSPARRSWHETLSAWLSCGIVVSKQRRCEVKLSRCETSTRRTQASTQPRLMCQLAAPFRQPL
jgi:hypothetical protein